ncbi:MAG: Asp23/Gls24 family envelope stress response protein [Eubacterium sp.]|nr:Asp23/Gls24 family envelope stress response protein [Eubacterium sp.]
MKGKVNSELGDIVINSEVITTYAGSVAVECFGIVGMAAVNMKDGLVRILKRDNLKHGIHVSIEDNRISIDFHVIVAYGVNIGTIAQNLMDSVTYKLEETTGMKVDKIRVLVEGVRIID